MNEMKELKKVMCDGAAKAILRFCEEEKISVVEFFRDFIYAYADDEFFAELCGICDKYGIDMFEGEAPYTYLKRTNIFFKMEMEKLSKKR